MNTVPVGSEGQAELISNIEIFASTEDHVTPDPSSEDPKDCIKPKSQSTVGNHNLVKMFLLDGPQCVAMRGFDKSQHGVSTGLVLHERREDLSPTLLQARLRLIKSPENGAIMCNDGMHGEFGLARSSRGGRPHKDASSFVVAKMFDRENRINVINGRTNHGETRGTLEENNRKCALETLTHSLAENLESVVATCCLFVFSHNVQLKKRK